MTENIKCHFCSRLVAKRTNAISTLRAADIDLSSLSEEKTVFMGVRNQKISAKRLPKLILTDRSKTEGKNKAYIYVSLLARVEETSLLCTIICPLT